MKSYYFALLIVPVVIIVLYLLRKKKISNWKKPVTNYSYNQKKITIKEGEFINTFDSVDARLLPYLQELIARVRKEAIVADFSGLCLYSTKELDPKGKRFMANKWAYTVMNVIWVREDVIQDLKPNALRRLIFHEIANYFGLPDVTKPTDSIRAKSGTATRTEVAIDDPRIDDLIQDIKSNQNQK